MPSFVHQIAEASGGRTYRIPTNRDSPPDAVDAYVLFVPIDDEHTSHWTAEFLFGMYLHEFTSCDFFSFDSQVTMLVFEVPKCNEVVLHLVFLGCCCRFQGTLVVLYDPSPKMHVE